MLTTATAAVAIFGLVGCSPTPTPAEPAVAPPASPDSHGVREAELRFSQSWVTLHQDGELRVSHELGDEEAMFELFGAVNELCVQPTLPKLTVFVEPDVQIDWTRQVLARPLDGSLGVDITTPAVAENGHSFELVSAHQVPEPEGCSRAYVVTSPHGYRLDVDEGTTRRRVGKAQSASELSGLLKEVPNPCSLAILQTGRRAVWGPLDEVGPALKAVGVHSIATEMMQPPEVQSYDTFELDSSRALLRLEHRQLFCCYVEGHHEGLAIAPPTGPSVYEGALPDWIPTSITLELEPQTYDVEVHAVAVMGGALNGCGTRVTLDPGQTMQLFHNMGPNGCTVASEETPSDQEWKNRPITLVRDPGKRTRRPWRLQVWEKGGRNPLVTWLAPATVRELTLPLVPGSLEFSLAEVVSVTGRPSWACQLDRLERCEGVEVETANPCEVVVDGEESYRITYRPGRSCKAARLPRR